MAAPLFEGEECARAAGRLRQIRKGTSMGLLDGKVAIITGAARGQGTELVVDGGLSA